MNMPVQTDKSMWFARAEIFFFFPTWPRHTEAVIFGRFLLKLCLNWVEAGAEEEDDEIFVLVFSRFRFCSRLDSPF